MHTRGAVIDHSHAMDTTLSTPAITNQIQGLGGAVGEASFVMAPSNTVR
jgi:hypothetical protein